MSVCTLNLCYKFIRLLKGSFFFLEESSLGILSTPADVLPPDLP